MDQNKKFNDIAFLRVVKPFIQKYGIDAATVIAELVYWQEQMNKRFELRKNDDFFFYEHFKIKKATGISTYRQISAMNILCEAGILTIKDEKRGTPPKKLYKVNINAYKEAVINANIGIRVEANNENFSVEDSENEKKLKSGYKKYVLDKNGEKVNLDDPFDNEC